MLPYQTSESAQNRFCGSLSYFGIFLPSYLQHLNMIFVINIKCHGSFNSRVLKFFHPSYRRKRLREEKVFIFLDLNNNNIRLATSVLIGWLFSCLTIANGRSDLIYVNFTFLCKWSWYLLELRQFCWHLRSTLCAGDVRGQQWRSHWLLCSKQTGISAPL